MQRHMGNRNGGNFVNGLLDGILKWNKIKQ